MVLLLTAFLNLPNSVINLDRVISKDIYICRVFFFFSSRRRHTRFDCDWSSDVCSSDLRSLAAEAGRIARLGATARNKRKSTGRAEWQRALTKRKHNVDNIGAGGRDASVDRKSGG